jgi:hypothetical protein
MGEGVRRQMQAVYGNNVRIQDAVVGRNQVMFALSEDGALLPEILSPPTQEQSLGKNARIRELTGRLPADPFGLVVVDLGRALAAAPHMAQVTVEVNEARRDRGPESPGGGATTDRNDEITREGPLLGWACVIRPTSFSGYLAISAKDAMETARIAKKLTQGFPTEARRVRIAIPPPRADN